MEKAKLKKMILDKLNENELSEIQLSKLLELIIELQRK